MSRLLLLVSLCLPHLGCQASLDRLTPSLSDPVAPRSYSDLRVFARTQANLVTERYYVNDWEALEDAARRLEQTVRSLRSAKDVPESQREELKRLCDDLARSTAELRRAVVSKDERESTAALARINLQVRKLLVDE